MSDSAYSEKAPAHDPELFDELMRAELRRQPINRWAVVALVTGLLGGLFAPIFAIGALIQIKDRRQRGRPLAIAGLAAFACWAVVTVVVVSTGSAWWQQPEHRIGLPQGQVSGLDLAVGDCFWSPALSGDTPVPRRSCTETHNGEAFAVLPLGDGPFSDVVAIYHESLSRCEAAKTPSPLPADTRIQVMTPVSAEWNQGMHRAVCYYHLGQDVWVPVREWGR